MKSLKQVYTVKKYLSLLLLVAAVTFTSSCDTIISNINELPETPDEGANNPNDPDSDAFVLPGISFTDGNYSLDQPFTVTDEQVTLSWTTVDSAGFSVDFDYEYQFRLAAPFQNLSSQDFIDLGDNPSITLQGLEETFGNESYDFEIMASPIEGSASQDTSFFGEFYVDANQDRAFVFSPSSISENSDGTYTATVYLDEISASDDLTAFSLVVSFNGTQITPIEEEIQVFEDDDFLNRSGVDEVLWFTEVEFSSVTIDVGLAGNDIDPISGGGAVCEIVFQPTSTFNGTNLDISTSSVLKTSTGADISIEAFDQATLIE
jgi:hypothetical protein